MTAAKTSFEFKGTGLRCEMMKDDFSFCVEEVEE